MQKCVPHVQHDHFFPLLTNNITAFWRFRCRTRPHFLNFLFVEDNKQSTRIVPHVQHDFLGHQSP